MHDLSRIGSGIFQESRQRASLIYSLIADGGVLSAARRFLIICFLDNNAQRRSVSRFAWLLTLYNVTQYLDSFSGFEIKGS